MKLRLRGSSISLDHTVVMGVLNVTPDSFSDGGLWLEPEAAIDHALEMVAEGAEIVDVGGESTRPGAEAVAEEEELQRVLPVISGLRAAGVEAISIDTRKPEVARRALAAGVSIVNDTAGEESTGAIDSLAAEAEAAVVVMHSRGTPATMRSLTDYDDVVRDVRSFLDRRASELRRAGVADDAIVLDPGIGFAKDAEQSLEILRRLDELTDLGHPVLVGASRKSFIGQTLDLPDGHRVEATVAANLWAAIKGARLVRVHDVQANVRALRMVEAITSSAS